MTEQKKSNSQENPTLSNKATDEAVQPDSLFDQASDLAKNAGPVAEILYSIAYVLPTFLAGPVRQLANTLRRTDMAARRIDRAKDKMDKQ